MVLGNLGHHGRNFDPVTPETIISIIFMTCDTFISMLCLTLLLEMATANKNMIKKLSSLSVCSAFHGTALMWKVSCL